MTMRILPTLKGLVCFLIVLPPLIFIYVMIRVINCFSTYDADCSMSDQRYKDQYLKQYQDEMVKE
jgi:hypothetical protein